MKKISRIVAAAMAVMTVMGVLPQASTAAKAPKLSYKSVEVAVGQKKVIKVNNGSAKASVKWKTSSKKVAKLTKIISKGNKASVTVVAVKKGVASITAVYKAAKRKSIKLTCKFRVTDDAKDTGKSDEDSVQTASPAPATATPAPATASPTSVPTATPTAEPTTEPTAEPTATTAPGNEEFNFVPIGTFLEDTNYDVPSGYSSSKGNEGTMVNITYPSTVIKEGEEVMRKAVVGLPKDYDESKKYPVIYVNHGIGGNETFMSGDNGFKNVLWNAVADGDAEEAIMVFGSCCANETNGPEDGNIFSLKHYEAYNNFLNDLEQCLMPYINENFSTYTDRGHTAICGFSMGGRVSLHIGFSRQKTFRYIGAFCPAPGILDFEDMGVSGPGIFTPETFTLDPEYMDDTLVLIYKGRDDTTVHKFPKEYHEALVNNEVPHIYNEIPGGHGGEVYYPAFYNFVRRIFKEEK